MNELSHASLFPKRKRSTHSRVPAPNEATLVCIDVSLGYVKGNVMIISYRAETIIDRLREVSVTPAELRLLANWYERTGASCGYGSRA